MPSIDELIAKLWNLHRRGVSYASSVPAVNLLLADLSEGIREAANTITDLQSLQREVERARQWFAGYVANGGKGADEELALLTAALTQSKDTGR